MQLYLKKKNSPRTSIWHNWNSFSKNFMKTERVHVRIMTIFQTKFHPISVVIENIIASAHISYYAHINISHPISHPMLITRFWYQIHWSVSRIVQVLSMHYFYEQGIWCILEYVFLHFYFSFQFNAIFHWEHDIDSTWAQPDYAAFFSSVLLAHWEAIYFAWQCSSVINLSKKFIFHHF